MGKKNKNKKRKRVGPDISSISSAKVNDDDSDNDGPQELEPLVVGTGSSKDAQASTTTSSASPAVVMDPTGKQAKKKKKRKRKKQKTEKASPTEANETTEDQEAEEAAIMSKSTTPSFPFPTEADDHCESPLHAYEHVVTILKALCRRNDSTIYDPYYCDGGVVRNLNSLGFANVYNVKEDCYKVWQQQEKQLPSFDILVTNPPYSGDHIERLMTFLSSPSFGNRPWLLLLPNWVHKKDYYVEATQHIRPFYIVPRKRYVYEPPGGFRETKKSDTHKKSSPFVSMWYVWGGSDAVNEKLIRQFLQSGHNTQECDLARSKSALRDLRRKKR